jgi:hypothetical protein
MADITISTELALAIVGAAGSVITALWVKLSTVEKKRDDAVDELKKELRASGKTMARARGALEIHTGVPSLRPPLDGEEEENTGMMVRNLKNERIGVENILSTVQDKDSVNNAVNSYLFDEKTPPRAPDLTPEEPVIRRARGNTPPPKNRR